MTISKPDSLARRLARTLTLWVGCVWLACVLGVVWYVDREIDYNFDSELVEVSHRMFDITLEQTDRASATRTSLSSLPVLLKNDRSAFPESAVPFQIVDQTNQVLSRSEETSAAVFAVPLVTGFTDAGAWRVYTLRHPSRPVFLQVADPLDERSAAVNRTLMGLILPLVAVLPFLAFLLHSIARRELRPVDGLAEELAQRDGKLLHPVALSGLPDELASLQEHINRLLERLALALDFERAMAANAAHELRTPLAVARLRLQTALDHGLHRSEVQAALTALETLSRRTEKLLELSRAESSAPLTRDRVDLIQLATAVAQEFWRETSALDRLDLVLPTDNSVPIVFGDFDALAIALRNLIQNALVHSGDGPVTLSVVGNGSLCVLDEGIGVAASSLETLRNRHVRENNGTHHIGYGLGLSIVTTIAAKHGATLRLQSPPPGADRGFQATITLATA